jgi:hypothetical protein
MILIRKSGNTKSPTVMKKYIYILAAAAFAFAACEKEADILDQVPAEPENSDYVTYTLTVSLAEEETKSFAYNDGEFVWETGDQIQVWDEASGSFKTFSCSSGGDVVTFSASLPAGTYNWSTAYYPAGIASDKTSVTIPAEYSSPNAVKPLLVAEVSGSSVTFKHICAYARVCVEEFPSVANKIVFSSTQVLAGSYTVNSSTAELSGASSTSNTVTVTCAAPEISYGFDVEMMIPIVPSATHCFSMDIKDTATPTAHTFKHVGGTKTYSLSRKSMINMATVALTPKVYLLADWREDKDIDDDNELPGAVWPHFYAERQIVADPANAKFHFVVKYGDLEVPYGFESSTVADSGHFLPWQTGDAQLSLTGMYFIYFSTYSGDFSTDWYPTMYLAGIEGDWATNKYDNGMTRIVHNVYGWIGDPLNSSVRPFYVSGAWVTDVMTTVSGKQNLIIVNTNALSDPNETYVKQGPFNFNEVYPYWVYLYSGSSVLAYTDDGGFGYVKFENLKLDATTELFIKEEWTDPEPTVYVNYGLSTSGKTLANGANEAAVVDGSPFKLTAGTYDIVYGEFNHHIYIEKKL